MKYYAVIDTNVVVSSLLSHKSIPGLVLIHVIDGTIVPLFNDEILDEYDEVLRRDKFGFLEEDVDKVLSVFRKKGIMLKRTETSEEFDDLEDVVFYEVALTGRSPYQSLLVTGNIRHFPAKSFVVTPRQMIQIIEAGSTC